MATIREAAFTVSWTTTYPALLADKGELTTRRRYTAMFDSPGADLGLPWQSVVERPSWSRFWSSYLGRGGGKIKKLGADSAWEHAIPFQLWHDPDIAGPPEATARSRVFIYPSAVSVIITVHAGGAWPLDSLAGILADLRAGAHWGANRTLPGIAADLRDRAAAILATDTQPWPDVPRTVAAPIAGEGTPEAFALTDATARSCVAGLAALGPAGILDDNRLLGANSDTNLASRFYVLKNGHAIWHPAYVLQQPEKDPIGCLVRNHTDLVAHIEAIGGMIEWAAGQITAGTPIPVAVHPLIRVAAQRLRLLYAGNKNNTYRSGVAMARTQPILATVDTVLRAL
jgi:hypothetical protein